MIYHVHFAGMHETLRLNPASYTVDEKIKKLHGKNIQTLLAETIKKRPKDQWIFIVTRDQKATFNKWLADNKLEDAVSFKMDKPIYNGNYMEQSPKLFLYTLQAKETQ